MKLIAYLGLALPFLIIGFLKAEPPAGIAIPDGAYESKDTFYVKAGGSAVFFNPPKYTLPTALDSIGLYGNQPFVFSGDQVTGQGSLTFGYVICHDPAADWLGSNLRVELSASYLAGSDTVTEQSNSNTPNGTSQVGYFDIRSISTGLPIGTSFATPGSPLISTTYDAEYEMATADLLVKTDYELGKGDGLFTPEAGIAFSYFDQRYGSSQYNIATPASNDTLQESMENLYIGPKLGFELKANFSKQLSMFLDVEGSFLDLESSYSGTQQVTVALGGPPTTTNATAADNRNQFALRGQFGGGLEYDFHPVVLRVSGGVDYWENVGQIVRTDPGFGANFRNGSGPSTIGHTTMTNENFTVAVIVPF